MHARTRSIKVASEKHTDGYLACPLGWKGVVIGAGNTYEEALADVKSAIRFRLETFGSEVLENESAVLEAFVAETGVAAWWRSFQLTRPKAEFAKLLDCSAFTSRVSASISLSRVKTRTALELL